MNNWKDEANGKRESFKGSTGMGKNTSVLMLLFANKSETRKGLIALLILSVCQCVCCFFLISSRQLYGSPKDVQAICRFSPLLHLTDWLCFCFGILSHIDSSEFLLRRRSESQTPRLDCIHLCRWAPGNHLLYEERVVAPEASLYTPGSSPS